jgi:predicted lipoprotein with Yx(FWY)xxD motif
MLKSISYERQEAVMKFAITVAMISFAALLSPSFAFAQAAAEVRIQVSELPPYGKVLTDGDGRALYMFTKDSKGTSDCYDACAKAWPPVVASGKPAAGPGLDDSKIGSTQRKDGATQVTYNGMPLYYFVKDQGPGEAKGQGIKAQGGEWYLVSPDGNKIEAKDKKS